MILNYLIAGAVNLDYLVNVESTRILHSTVKFLPLSAFLLIHSRWLFFCFIEKEDIGWH